jgi:hypothetical protein
VVSRADRPDHGCLVIGQGQLLGRALEPADIRRPPQRRDPPREPQHGRVRIDAGGGGGAPGRDPDGGAGAAADVDHPVGGCQLGGFGDGSRQRAPPGGHRQRGDDLPGPF